MNNEQETIVLGIVGIKNMGVYNASTTYERLNVVTYQGSTYCALKDTTGNLPTNTEYWQLYAQKGDIGDTGPQGPKPVKGVDYYTDTDKAEIEADLADDISDAVSESVGNLTSATPLVASSVAGMIDTTRVYVNTTDGHWYWYDGDSWEDGGTYQATEDSTAVNNLIERSPKMVKYIQNNTIKIERTDTHLNITSVANANTYFFTENNFLSLPQSQVNTSFAKTDYDTTGGTWFLYISKGAVNEIKLVSYSATKTWKPDDMIIAIIRPTQIISLVPYNLIYQNNDIGIIAKSMGFLLPISSYNRLNVINNTTNKTFSLTTSGLQVVLITNQIFTAIPANRSKTLSYDITLSGSSIVGVIWSQTDNDFKLINLPSTPDNKNNAMPEPVYSKQYGDVLLFTYHVPSGRIFPYINEFYYNGNLISNDKINNEITNLQTQINLIENKPIYDFLRCFKNFTFIGDSLTAGFTSINGHVINSATAKAQNNNWPSYLCSRLNRSFTNLAQGSSTIENWRYANQSGNPDTDITKANITTGIYFVCLGVNDARQSKTIGTSADINESDYTQNANSVYGNYDYIINKLKSYNPYAKIFTFTLPNNETNASTYNTAIKYVSNLYDNVYCIDLYELYDFTTGFLNDNFINGHYNPITYNYISSLIESAVNKYIFENYTDFQLVPYNY